MTHRSIAHPAVSVMADGALLFRGPSFLDNRGWSYEAYSSHPPYSAFPLVQENIVASTRAGTLRGLHYQLVPRAQGKLVNILNGRGQFFWVSLDSMEQRPKVHSICLEADGAALYTPGNCAHGFLALEDDTIFSLKLDTPIDGQALGQISLFADDLDVHFEVAPRRDLLSPRDAEAPCFHDRRR